MFLSPGIKDALPIVIVFFGTRIKADYDVFILSTENVTHHIPIIVLHFAWFIPKENRFKRITFLLGNPHTRAYSMAMRNQWTVNKQIIRNNSSLLILNDYLYLLIDSGRRFLNIIVIPAVYLFLSSCRCFLNVIRVYVDFSNTSVKVPIDSSLQYTITFSPRDWVIVLVQNTPFLCFPLVAIVYPLLIRPHWECDPLLEDRNPDSSMRWTREHIPFWVDQFLYAFSLRSQFSVY